jgi:hypothetical protein
MMSYRLRQPNRQEAATMPAISSNQLTLFEPATTQTTPSPLPAAEVTEIVGPLLQALLSGITAAEASSPSVAAADEPAS